MVDVPRFWRKRTLGAVEKGDGELRVDHFREIPRNHRRVFSTGFNRAGTFLCVVIKWLLALEDAFATKLDFEEPEA
jgi:hypothetical protein